MKSSQWLEDYFRQKQQSRLKVVKAMRWFRDQTGDKYGRLKVVNHGWHGHVVMGTMHHETVVVEKVENVLKQYEEAMKCEPAIG